jgi:hypothetical protein
MRDKSAPKAARLQAAGMILDRAYCKAESNLNINKFERGSDVHEYSDAELHEMIAAGKETKALADLKPPTTLKQ